ncbi:hypothetical protein CDL15_Pgr013167 [Punica granatum]|uniref:Uncharacterized protein n=1 Tax=Punica granatum TaxID=22663 RepID=A0A218WE73_PUNGR|nr:hypothetical protein CDL15_Pgr013167 [Punica granatum]
MDISNDARVTSENELNPVCGLWLVIQGLVIDSDSRGRGQPSGQLKEAAKEHSNLGPWQRVSLQLGRRSQPLTMAV